MTLLSIVFTVLVDCFFSLNFLTTTGEFTDNGVSIMTGSTGNFVKIGKFALLIFLDLIITLGA